MDIKKLSNKLRFRLIKMSYESKAPHLASSLSCIDIVTVLYESIMRINPKKPKWELRDRFILSKGHAATALYVALEYKKYEHKSITINDKTKNKLRLFLSNNLDIIKGASNAIIAAKEFFPFFKPSPSKETPT